MAASVRTQAGELAERTLGGLPTLGGETVHLGEEWFARVYRLDEESRTIFLGAQIARQERVRARTRVLHPVYRGI